MPVVPSLHAFVVLGQIGLRFSKFDLYFPNAFPAQKHRLQYVEISMKTAVEGKTLFKNIKFD